MDSLPLMALVSVYYFSLSWNVITAPAVLRAGPEAVDGELYIQKFAKGEDVPENPGYLFFTAPYKLTTCVSPPCQRSDYPNLVMAFPVFIGDNSDNRQIFSTLYPKDTDLQTIFRTSPRNSYTTSVCPNTTCEMPFENVDPRARSTIPYFVRSKPSFRLAFDPRRTAKEAQGNNKRPEQTTSRLVEMRESDYV